MTIEQKRLAVQAKIAAFVHDGVDLSKTTCEQAYATLYPDQIEFGLFRHVWEHFLGNSEAAKAVAAQVAGGSPASAGAAAAATDPAPEGGTPALPPPAADVHPD